jgi:predicted MFS family arabinose efflux permease
MKSSLVKLLLMVILIGCANSIFMSLMPDYLSNGIRIGGDVRGALEIPRELPGFFLVFIAGALVRIPIRKALAMIFSLGVLAFAGLAFFPSGLVTFVLFMVMWSSAMHAFLPVRDTAAIELAGKNRRGWVLGRVGAFRSLGLILGTAVVWILMDRMKAGFQMTWLAAAVLLVPGIVLGAAMPGSSSEDARCLEARKFIVRKEYRLYYMLSMFFGARKQIFITFAPWLLVSVYDQKAAQLALAMGASALIGIFLKPFMGNLIDRYGERKVLLIDALLIMLLSSAYAVVPHITGPAVALALLYCFYVLDELLFSLSMARTTYLSSIIMTDAEMVPTIGLGGTIDHIVSMTVPLLGGILWVSVGSWSVFAMAGVVAVFTFLTVWRMPRR